MGERNKKDGAIFLDKSIAGTRCAETGTRGGNKAAGDRGRDSGKYCVVILHFASGKLDLGKEKGQESIYKFAMENILAEAFTEKSKWKM